MTDGKAGWYVVALSGLISGSAVGVGVNFVGGSWKMVALCAMLGVAIGTFLYKQGESALPNKPLIQLFKMGRSLAVGFKLFFASICILTICIIYSGSNEIPLHTAFGLFLLLTILTVLLFGTSLLILSRSLVRLPCGILLSRRGIVLRLKVQWIFLTFMFSSRWRGSPGRH
jgi:hypothetical protein